MIEELDWVVLTRDIPELDYPDVSASRRSHEDIGEFSLHCHGRA